MKKGIRYVLAGILALLGFSSCASLHEAQERRALRDREAFDAQQQALVEETLREMLEADANNPELQKKEVKEPERDWERMKLLYGVPNVPYRGIEK